MLAFHHFLHLSHDAVDYNVRFYACAYNACGYISISSLRLSTPTYKKTFAYPNNDSDRSRILDSVGSIQAGISCGFALPSRISEIC